MFKSMSIRKKMLSMLIIVALLGSLGGIFSAFTLKSIQVQYENNLQNYGNSQGEIGKLMVYFQRLNGDIHDMVSYQNQEEAQNASNEISEYSNKVNTYFAQIEENLANDKEKEIFQSAQKAWEEYQSIAESINTDKDSIMDNAGRVELQTRLVNELNPDYNTILDSLINLMDDKVSNEETKDVSNNIVFVIVLIIIALGISIILGIYQANSMTKPISACAERLEALAEGDLTSEVPTVNTNDEISVLVRATGAIVKELTVIIQDMNWMLSEMANGRFNIKSDNREFYVGDFAPLFSSVRTINHELSDALAQINQSAEQVNAGAEQVSHGAQALAQGTTQQASAVEQLSATVNEIATGARNNAQTARAAREHSQLAGQQVTISNEYMQKMIEAMGNISNSSEEIAKIIRTIENIAFQTNILALNAAVEAARAGTAGKGFAVVADEVRNLASKSDQAAKATKELIEGSVNAVKGGNEIVDNVSSALQESIKLVDQSVKDMGIIADAVESEADSISQVTDGIDQISAVIQNNSAASEESAAASEELSSQSVIMKDLMSRFQLRNTEAYMTEAQEQKNNYSSVPRESQNDAETVTQDIEDTEESISEDPVDEPSFAPKSVPHYSDNHDIFSKY